MVAGLKDSGRPDMGVLTVAPEWRAKATSACVFTTNAFAAAPVVLNRTECDLGHLVAVVMNSGNANACTGEPGLAVARSMQKACADALGVPAAQVAVASTGIIGVQLDSGVVTRGAVKAAQAVKADGGPEFNRSIMTTDRFPKICAVSVETSAGVVRLGVCGKGAGMIAPAMATMLCVVTTDAELDPETMQTAAEQRGGEVVQPHHRRRGDEHQRQRVVPGERGIGHRARRRRPRAGRQGARGHARPGWP